MVAASFQDKVVVVTGGASGIGLATVKKLLEAGASVSLCDIDDRALSSAPMALGSIANPNRKLNISKTDVTKRDAIARLLSETKAMFGRIDAIASVAGTGGHRLGHEEIWQTATEEYDFIFDVYVRSTFNMLAESLKPGVLSENNSSIVCVGSMFSQQGFEKGAVFSASKHAMVGMVKGAAKEAGSREIRVNAVLPGAINTPMHQRNIDSGFPMQEPTTPLKRLGTAEEVADVILFLLSESALFVTGSEYLVDGGANA